MTAAEAPAQAPEASPIPGGVSELSLEDALRLGMQLMAEQRFEGARTLYQRILQAAPSHPDALALLGLTEFMMGRGDEGIALLRQAIEQAPAYAGFRINLGNMLVELDRLDEALVVLQDASHLPGAPADLFSNLGVVLRALGRRDESEQAYRRAIETDPQHVRAWNNLGLLHEAQGDRKAANHCYLKALELQPGHHNATYLLGMSYYKDGLIADAAEVFRMWAERDRDNPIPAHLYAACSGKDVPARASDAYVEREFDNFANSFEKVLNQRLGYRAPQLCCELLDRQLPAAPRRLALLDAGCGTGLCGPLVAPWAERLVGVDLSQGMLTKARTKGVYHDLVKAELTAYLRDTPAQWDAIVCADTLCYFGDLHEVVAAAGSSLRDGGAFVFTVEALPDDEASEPRIQPHGRYAHGRAHLRRVLAAAGLREREARREVLRHEGGKPVDGWLIAAQRPAAGSLH